MKSTSDVSYEAVWEANRYLVKVTQNDGTVSLYVAIFGKEYLLKIGAEDELDKVQDVQANRVFTLGADAREFYEFIGWKYSLSNVFYRLTDETGAFTEENGTCFPASKPFLCGARYTTSPRTAALLGLPITALQTTPKSPFRASSNLPTKKTDGFQGYRYANCG